MKKTMIIAILSACLAAQVRAGDNAAYDQINGNPEASFSSMLYKWAEKTEEFEQKVKDFTEKSMDYLKSVNDKWKAALKESFENNKVTADNWREQEMNSRYGIPKKKKEDSAGLNSMPEESAQFEEEGSTSAVEGAYVPIEDTVKIDAPMDKEAELNAKFDNSNCPRNSAGTGIVFVPDGSGGGYANLTGTSYWRKRGGSYAEIDVARLPPSYKSRYENSLFDDDPNGNCSSGNCGSSGSKGNCPGGYCGSSNSQGGKGNCPGGYCGQASAKGNSNSGSGNDTYTDEDLEQIKVLEKNAGFPEDWGKQDNSADNPAADAAGAKVKSPSADTVKGAAKPQPDNNNQAASKAEVKEPYVVEPPDFSWDK
ncbi:hypothetical protein ACFL6Y_10380 [Elusimicrobiota bacterium]